MTESDALVERDDRGDHLQASKLSEELQMKILESIQAGRPLNLPKAASEVDFDIEDPPETFREASKIATAETNSDLGDFDVVFPSNLNYSRTGNTSFRNLLYDFQPFYILMPRAKRRYIHSQKHNIHFPKPWREILSTGENRGSFP